MRGKLRTLVIAALVGISSTLFGVTPNMWQAVDGVYDGNWGDVRHWSLGHLPAAGEVACFDAWTVEGGPNRWITYTVTIDADYEADLLRVGPNTADSLEDVTFAGSGSVTFSGASYNSADGYTWHRLTQNHRGLKIDGPTIDLRNSGVLSYLPLVVKNGGTFKVPSYVLWIHESLVTVEAGGTVEVGGVFSYGFTPDSEVDSVTVKAGGVLTIAGALREGDSRYATRRINMKVEGGKLSVGELNFSRGTESLDVTSGELTLGSLTLAAGAKLHVGTDCKFTLNKAPSIASDDQVSLDGGDIAFNFDVPYDGNTFISSVFTNKNVRSLACNVVCATGPNPIKSVVPLTTYQFRNLDAGSAEQIIDLDEIVFRGGVSFPFYWFGNRVNRLYGPTKIRTLSDMTHSGCNAYLYCYGPMTIDTADPADPTLKHKVYLRGVTSGNGSLELTVTGGGSAQIDPAFTYNVMDTVAVDANTELSLGDCTLGSQGQNYDWMRLVTDAFSLGAGAVLKFNAQAQSVSAANWNIDPTARIVIAAPTSFEYGAFPILHDLESKEFSDALLSQIEITGNEQGLWSLRNEFGQITLYRDYPAGTFSGNNWEWKGGDGNLFTNVNNWVVSNPPEYMEQTDGPHYFGAATQRRIYALGKMRRSSVPDFGGASVNGWNFLATATGSYFLYGGVQHNLYSPISNFSALPQVLGTSLRWWEPQLYAQGFGPLVISGDNGLGGRNASFALMDGGTSMYLKGDVRFGITFTHPNLGMFFESQYPAVLGSLTVIPGGNFTFSRQRSAMSLSTHGTFRVAENATLTFADDASSFYQLSSCGPASFINGTMNINVPFYGGVNQAYRGRGTLNMASTRSGSASSRVEFGGQLTVCPAIWNTVTADNIDAAVAIGVRGSPTLKVADGWTYGPASGVATSTTADQRALSIAAGSALKVDASGGVAVFADPVNGEGVLVVTNGAVRLDGGLARETTLTIAADGTYSVAGTQELGGSLSGTGGTLAFVLPATLAVQGAVSLEGLAVRFNSNRGGVHNWLTLVTSPEPIVGMPTLPGNWKCRTVFADGVCQFQARPIPGTALLIR